MSATCILLPRFVLPIRPAGEILHEHAVVIDGQRIVALLPAREAEQRYPEAERVQLAEHVLLPGLVNMHTHSPMALLRGMADDLDLQTWLQGHIWPAESRWVGPEFVRDGTELAMAEMLRGGTTCFNEMYFFPEVIAEAADSAGMRACIGLPVIDVATPWAADADSCLARAGELRAAVEASDLLTMSLAPHAAYTVGDAAMRQVAELAAELDVPVSMHLLEVDWEVEHSLREYGKPPLERLQAHGLLGPRFIAVHMAHPSEPDIRVLAESGTHVVHCPESSLKLASGMCPVARLLSAGVNVCVGTDGAASNNNLDLLSELRTAALLAKGVAGDPCALGAWQALELATINAARALGLEEEIGSIEAGKLADLCAIDLAQPETQPLHHVASQVVYAASCAQVTDVWVGGRRLLARRELTTLDIGRVLEGARAWNERLAVAEAT